MMFEQYIKVSICLVGYYVNGIWINFYFWLPVAERSGYHNTPCLKVPSECNHNFIIS